LCPEGHRTQRFGHYSLAHRRVEEQDSWKAVAVGSSEGSGA
jgi:hypothetical protein